MAVRPIDANVAMKKIREYMEDFPNANTRLATCRVILSMLGDENQIPPLTPPNEWVSVEERLPEYNPGAGAKSYWIAKKDSKGNWQMKIAQYCDYGYAMLVDAETEVTWRDWDFTKIADVNHWMELPEPPKEDN